MFINGSWCSADNGKTFQVNNPATGEWVADVPDGGQPDARRAIHAAHDAFDEWAAMTAYPVSYTHLTQPTICSV